MEMTSNWRSSIDPAADARLKNSRTWERARVFIHIYMLRMRLLFIEHRRLSCVLDLTPCCVHVQLHLMTSSTFHSGLSPSTIITLQARAFWIQKGMM